MVLTLEQAELLRAMVAASDRVTRTPFWLVEDTGGIDYLTHDGFEDGRHECYAGDVMELARQEMIAGRQRGMTTVWDVTARGRAWTRIDGHEETRSGRRSDSRSG